MFCLGIEKISWLKPHANRANLLYHVPDGVTWSNLSYDN